ncbi:MAG: hypothetical protein GX375_05595 [Clostridiales bacterium]|nr:hypothetical protein [Clostridiales bacterium]
MECRKVVAEVWTLEHLPPAGDRIGSDRLLKVISCSFIEIGDGTKVQQPL